MATKDRDTNKHWAEWLNKSEKTWKGKLGTVMEATTKTTDDSQKTETQTNQPDNKASEKK